MAASLWPNQATFIAVLCIFSSTRALASHVPLLIWSSDSLPPVAPPAAGHITSSSELSAFLSSALSSGTHTVLLFLQDKLSQDDFTRYGGVFGNKEDSAFKNIEAALQSHSVVFPALEWTGSSAVPALLAEKLGVSPALVAPETFPDLQMDSSVNNLFLINMPYCGQDKPCRETLKENDETVGQVLKTLEDKKVAYTALFTGVQPSRVIAELSLSGTPVGRSLLQTPAPPAVPPPIMYNVSGNPCIMLWAQNLNVSFTETEIWTDLAQQTPTLTGSFCNASNSVLVLTYTGGITLSFFMSQRFYPVSARAWFTLDRVLLQQNAVTVSFSSRLVSAPAEYSYHCQSVSSFRDALLTPINTTTTWKVNLIDFQIQGFSLNNGTNFSYASDCAGFFTPGIWMGLLTSLLMLWIFVYGLHMILQLNTMDRFDDPKGPCISVPQTE
uniref:ATPase H+ transporting accessory protein 1b n=1 Tax=Neogobius melanostomus TaxID=47308 RepID=A0A8C6UDK1_9GOBI